MNCTEPQISVIVPCYNTEKFLAQAMDSVLSQSGVELEIICVDDGSTDGTLAILEKYAAQNSQIKLIAFADNQGVGAARNAALAQAQGKYIFLLDSDDALPAGGLKKLYDLAEAENLEQIIFRLSINGDGSGFWYPEYPAELTGTTMPGCELLGKMLDARCFIVAGCLRFTRASLLKRHNISFPAGIIHEDNYFSCMTLIHATRARCITDEHYIRRVRSASIMTAVDQNANLRHAEGYLKTYILLWHEIVKLPPDTPERHVLQEFNTRMFLHIRNYIQKLDAAGRQMLYSAYFNRYDTEIFGGKIFGSQRTAGVFKSGFLAKTAAFISKTENKLHSGLLLIDSRGIGGAISAVCQKIKAKLFKRLGKR